MLNSFAIAIGRYHDGSMPYIKLLDGGLVDNYGLAGFTIARLSSDTPYGPLNPRQAVKLRRGMFLVVDAKDRRRRQLDQYRRGPGSVQIS